MEAEDIIQLPTSGSDSGSEGEDASKLSKSQGEDGVEGHVGNGQNNVGQIMDDPEIEEGQLLSEAEISRDVIGDSSCCHERVDFVEAAETQVLDCVAIRAATGCINDTEVEEGQLVPEIESGEIAAVNTIDFTENFAEFKEKHVCMPSENGCVADHETSNSYPEKNGGSITGVKRIRPASEGLQPSVHVKYHGLSRQSKRKLEQLLREWSEWCARNASRSRDQDDVPASGEEIYFPALDVGMGKTSTLSFWMENEVKSSQDKHLLHVEDDSVPLYDRGFALGLTSAEGSNNLEGGMEVLDAPRCFNCGSYSHSLKECPKPRDNAAVNNSRKQLKSRRNQTAGMRNLTRYYQDSPGGKYEGLRPGVLAPETRQLLGLGEFDPPPWLNRMREIGYPPGYLGKQIVKIT
uniref:CCHC-type domain-containing protein n=1 Tax=Opuntia streptacantha TaxID=393608 RepID=A0A7C9D3H9_OPUST